MSGRIGAVADRFGDAGVTLLLETHDSHDIRHRGAVLLALFGVGPHRQRGQQRVAIGIVLLRRGHAHPGPTAGLGHRESADPLGEHQFQRGLLQRTNQWR
jgi:hypothetical protein